MSIEEELTDLRKQIEEAKIKRAKIQHEQDLAEVSKEECLKQLKAAYGVDSTSSARELLVEMDAKLAESIRLAQAKLEESRNGS